MRGVLVLKYPMKNGIISNWEEMEKGCLLLTYFYPIDVLMKL
jgi:actin-related protein